MNLYDETEIRKGLALLHPDGEVFEVRVISNDGKSNWSGYFRDSSTLIEALENINITGCNVYTTINPLANACYSRAQHDHFVRNPKTATSDSDIVNINFLFVDLDPKRPAGVSSSEEELKKAKELGNKVFVFMRENGFHTPITAYSGNGVHLLYRVDLPNDAYNVELVRNCLNTLGMLFSNDDVEVDLKTFNPSRVCKLYGTVAQKGYDTTERPFRISRVLGSKPVEATETEYVSKIANMIPTEPERPQKYNNYSPRDFDLDNWLSTHGLNYKKYSYGDGAKYVLDCCPFDPNHNGKDAAIFRRGNGAIGFHCFHNSCSGKTWRDVRIKFEPEAYELREQYREARTYRNYNRDRVAPVKHIAETDGTPVFLSAKDILEMPEREEAFIRTGVNVIDKKLRGLRKGAVSLLSGLRGAAKSTVLSQWALNAINGGFNVGVFSGELAPRNFMRWMFQQAAGRGRVVESDTWEGYYSVPRIYQQQIAEWMSGRFFLYNNEYGNDFSAVEEQFVKKIESDKLDFLILDNLMAFDISGLAENKWEAQTSFVWRLHNLAQQKNVHILFVAHPRKAMGFLRLDDISGSADLANAVDAAFIVHRTNRDFARLTQQMFGWKDSEPIYSSTNVIEIAKDRDGGTQDEFVPLWYEKETKRLKNDVSESIVYGWDGGDTNIWESMPADTEFENLETVEELVFN